MADIIKHLALLVFCFVGSITLGMMVLPRIIYIAKKKRLLDIPDKRKKHHEPIPRLGGISFTPIILLMLALMLFIKERLGLGGDSITELLLFTCGSVIILLLGVKDDLVGVTFKRKFLVQFIASLFIVGSGTYINSLGGLFGIHDIHPIAGIILSILLVVFTTNAMNLIDGADGLASGLSILALLFYTILCCIYGMYTYAGLAIITIGVLIPFFYYNFHHPKRKIFMGDTGSLTLGYLLSFLMIHLSQDTDHTDVASNGLLLLVVSGLFIPLFDAARVMFSRISSKDNPFRPDRNHIHHKLLDLDNSKKATLAIIISCGVLIIALNWILLQYINSTIVFFVDITLAILANHFVNLQTRKRRKQVEVMINGKKLIKRVPL